MERQRWDQLHKDVAKYKNEHVRDPCLLQTFNPSVFLPTLQDLERSQLPVKAWQTE